MQQRRISGGLTQSFGESRDRGGFVPELNGNNLLSPSPDKERYKTSDTADEHGYPTLSLPLPLRLRTLRELCVKISWATAGD